MVSSIYFVCHLIYFDPRFAVPVIFTVIVCVEKCVEIQSCSIIGYVIAAVQAAAHVCGRLHRV
jgi:hypothetical protein